MPERREGGGRVGSYVLDSLLRTDDLGEVYRAEGPDGPVRLRLLQPRDPEAAGTVLARLAALRSPAVAAVLDRIVEGSRLAVVTAADVRALPRRLPPGSAVAAGAVLLDGLAALHGAGMAHGHVSRQTAAVDAAGRLRWQDAGLAAVVGRSGSAADDLAGCARLLRGIAGLPRALRGVVDPVAAGEPAAATLDAAALATAWRQAAREAALPVPPAGADVLIPGLLEQPRRRRLAGRRPPRLTRPVVAALVAALGLAVVPGARLVAGGGPVLPAASDLLPRSGARLTYRIEETGTHGGELQVTVQAGGGQAIAGVPTATLTQVSPTPPVADLSFGLSGTTLRVEDGSLVRTVPGGAVRDLLAGAVPGTSWSDSVGQPQGGGVVTETRTLLGPVDLVEPAGRLAGCIAVRDVTSTRTAAGPGAAAAATLWLCPGVGLARAVLDSQDAHSVIDLVAR